VFALAYVLRTRLDVLHAQLLPFLSGDFISKRLLSICIVAPHFLPTPYTTLHCNHRRGSQPPQPSGDGGVHRRRARLRAGMCVCMFAYYVVDCVKLSLVLLRLLFCWLCCPQLLGLFFVLRNSKSIIFSLHIGTHHTHMLTVHRCSASWRSWTATRWAPCRPSPARPWSSTASTSIPCPRSSGECCVMLCCACVVVWLSSNFSVMYPLFFLIDTTSPVILLTFFLLSTSPAATRTPRRWTSWPRA